MLDARLGTWLRLLAAAALFALCSCSQPSAQQPAKQLAGAFQRSNAISLQGIRGGTAITLHSAVTSFATPTGTGGADISSARGYGAGPQGWTIEMTASVATVITGPLAIYDEADDGSIHEAGLLNDGADIIIPSVGIGVEWEVNLGTAKKLQVGTAPTAANPTGWTSTPSGGAAVTVKARPRFEVAS